MAGAAITFPGGTVTNVWLDSAAARLNGAEPASMAVGQRRTLLATGAPRVWSYRDDHTLAIELRDIANADIERCLALALHLSGGGVVTVVTGDLDDRTYGNVVLAPGAEAPQPKLDPKTMRWSMSATLLNLDGAPFFARYG